MYLYSIEYDENACFSSGFIVQSIHMSFFSRYVVLLVFFYFFAFCVKFDKAKIIYRNGKIKKEKILHELCTKNLFIVLRGISAHL